MLDAASFTEADWSRLERDYRRLVDAAGCCELTGRTRIELVGADAAAFLHNLCTNAVTPLAEGEGCEAFLTIVQGRTLSYLLISRTDAGVVVESTAEQGAELVAHFDKYLITERVEVFDRTEQKAWLLVAGPGVGEVLAKCDMSAPAKGTGARVSTSTADVDVELIRYDYTSGDDVLIVCPRESLGEVQAAIVDAGAPVCCDAAVEARRIERASPLFGVDVTAENLPQEVDRNDRAISFTKGCYLGQETVARIDALGHVNRQLCLVRLEIDDKHKCPPTVEFSDAGKAIGGTTSVAWSPSVGRPVALAYLRRGRTAPGTRLVSDLCDAEVLPKP